MASVAQVRAARAIAVEMAQRIQAIPTTQREREAIARAAIRELMENIDRLRELADEA